MTAPAPEEGKARKPTAGSERPDAAPEPDFF